jgi:hypothetical protein
MTADEVKAQRPKAWQVYEMDLAKVPWEQIASQLGIGQRTIYLTINEVIRLLKYPPGHGDFKNKYTDSDAPRTRCKCGLMLPCDDCIHRVEHYLGNREEPNF